MQVEAIPLIDFVHNHIDAHEGRPIVPWIEESLARQLEQAGLVRIRLQHAKPVNEPGKPQDDGAGLPSSVSPPAPASPTTTSQPSGRGPGRPRKNAA